MMLLAWVAIGIGCPVAYAAVAGMAWRYWGATVPDECNPDKQSCTDYHSCPNHTERFQAGITAALWPIFAVIMLCVGVVWCVYFPLRATFRLTAGQLRNHT